MKYAFILLLALFCYAQLVSSGGRGGRRGRRRGQLEKDIANLGEDINCLMEEMKKCKSEIKGLNDKFSEMLTMLYKKDQTMVCSFFPDVSFPAGDGCNVCSCGPNGGFPMCSKRPVPCDSNDGCPPFTPDPRIRCLVAEICTRETCAAIKGPQYKCCNTLCGQKCMKKGCYDKNGKFFAVGAEQFDGCNWCTCSKDFKWTCTEKACLPKDPCKLPNVPGPCKGYFPSWYYDYTSGKCKQFIYGGCQGNANRFSSKKECKKTCVKKGCCYNGCFYKVGKSFRSADGCNMCHCRPGGSVSCTKKYCKTVCPSRPQFLPGKPTKCPKKKPCGKGKLCCTYGCKSYCMEGVNRDICPRGLPMVSINGQKLSCGWGFGSNECPLGSTCVADPLNRSGVCCPTVVCPKYPPANAKKCPKKKLRPCPKGKMCCPYGCKSLCVDGVEPKCPSGEPLIDPTTGKEWFCGRGPTRQDCPKGTYCNIHPTDRYAVCCGDKKP